MAQRVRLLTLTVTASSEIQRMKIEESDGAITDFVFSAIEENVAVATSDFTFAPPPGVTIVDGQSPI
jgi:outer membrane lipoprotein carrier protein